MSHKSKSALLRLARVGIFAAVSAGIAAVTQAVSGGALNDTAFVSLAGVITAGLASLDKYIRATLGAS